MAIERAQQPAYTSGAAASAAAEAEYLRDQNKPDEAQLATLNSEFDSQGTNNSYWDSVYNQYTEQHGSAVEKNNMEEAARLNAEYTALMDRKDYFDNVTLESMYEDQSEQWTWDEIKYNDQLINSLRRTNGAYNEYGEEKTIEQLMTEFVRDQQYLEYNLTKKGIEASKYDEMTDEQKEDLTLQYLSFQKLLGSEGEGGIPSAQSWVNIPGALLSDPTTYIGGGLIANIVSKGAAKFGLTKALQPLTNKLFGNRIAKFLSTRPVTKTTATTATYGGIYTGYDKFSDERILQQAESLGKEGKDWIEIGKATGLGVAVGGSLGFLLRGGFQLFKNKSDDWIIKQKLQDPEYNAGTMINEMAASVKDEKSLKVYLKRIGYNRKEIAQELKNYREWDSKQSIALPGAEKSFDVPLTPKNTEAGTFGPSTKDEFKASGSRQTAEEVNAARRAAEVVDDTSPATEAIYYPGQTADEASTILKEVEPTYSTRLDTKPRVEKIAANVKPKSTILEPKSRVLKELDDAKWTPEYSKAPSVAVREIDGTVPINPHEGIALPAKTEKVLKEIRQVDSTSNASQLEIANSRVLREKIDNTFTPEEKVMIKEGEDLIDEAFIDIESIDIPISFSRLGQRAYDWINNTMGKGATRMLYGTDSILVRSGQRPIAEAISSAQATTDINVARIANDLQTFVAKNADELGELNKLIARAIPENQAQKDFLAMLNKKKMAQLKVARDTGVISKAEYARFKHDKGYVPRVWNTQKLITLKGAEEFSVFLNKIWGKDPKEVRNLITNLTGEKKLTDEIINSKFSPENIRAMFRRKADREMDVKRSTHLEFERKLKIKPELERELDAFMAAPLDRWTKFFEDVIRRNEYAKRFGKNDERIKKKIKEMREKGMGRQAEDVQEVYFTAVGDPKYSETIRARMDNPRLQQAVAKVNAFQNLKLGLAAIPNATQAFVNGTVMLTKSGSLLTAPFKAMSSLVKAIVKTRQGMDAVHNAGVLGEIDLSRIATENMPHARIVEREFKGPLKYLNEPTAFLRATGFLGVEQMNRRAAAIMAHGHVSSINAKLQRLVMQGKGNSKKSLMLQKEMKQLGIMNPLKGDLTARDYAISGHMFNKHVNFSGESFNLPVNWQKPWFKLMTKFKSFMFYQARFLKRQVADELFINKNPKPLLAYLAAAGIAGNQAELARALVSGKEIEQNRTALELLISGIGNAGGAGLWFDTMQQVATRGPGGAWSAITGPTFSDIAYTAEDLANSDVLSIIERMAPNLPGKGMIFNEWRDQ
jgi:uncharacterized protein YxeA